MLCPLFIATGCSTKDGLKSASKQIEDKSAAKKSPAPDVTAKPSPPNKTAKPPAASQQKDREAILAKFDDAIGKESDAKKKLSLELMRASVEDGETELDLSKKGLTTLPPEIGLLLNLLVLKLERNELRTLPPEIGNLTNLTHVHLNDNQLTTLPSGIVQLKNLTRLEIDGNQFTALPREIGELTNLEILSLKGNSIASKEIERLKTALPKCKMDVD